MNKLRVRVSRKQQEAENICSLLLTREDGSELLGAAPGTHIDVYLPGGAIRQYSVCNAESDRGGYLVAVQKEQSSRGGSLAVHEKVEVGSILEISEPRNNFPLVGASRYLLIAGGIGITPIITMAERLAKDHADFEMHYCAKSTRQAAFLDRIKRSTFGPLVQFHYSEEGQASRIDLATVLDSMSPETHVYVCGPASLTEATLAAAEARGWRKEALHREYFNNSHVSHNAELEKEFSVKLARSGKVFSICPDKTIYEVLIGHGIDIPVSCESGVCGTCLTRVLEGTPDHRDVFLSDEEHAQNDQFTLCCSRAHSSLLVLDL